MYKKKKQQKKSKSPEEKEYVFLGSIIYEVILCYAKKNYRMHIGGIHFLIKPKEIHVRFIYTNNIDLYIYNVSIVLIFLVYSTTIYIVSISTTMIDNLSFNIESSGKRLDMLTHTTHVLVEKILTKNRFNIS